jgi:hypothetical protein
MDAADEQASRPFVWFPLPGSGMSLSGEIGVFPWVSRCAVCAVFRIRGVLMVT